MTYLKAFGVSLARFPHYLFTPTLTLPLKGEGIFEFCAF